MALPSIGSVARLAIASRQGSEGQGHEIEVALPAGFSPTTHQLVIDVAGDDLAIGLAPLELEQVVLNLCVNARDAMPRGGELRLSTSVVDLTDRSPPRDSDALPGRYVRLTLEDTGAGMGRPVSLSVKRVTSRRLMPVAVLMRLTKRCGAWPAKRLMDHAGGSPLERRARRQLCGGQKAQAARLHLAQGSNAAGEAGLLRLRQWKAPWR